nr:hypothetical protein [Ferrithrix thermotolerans]
MKLRKVLDPSENILSDLEPSPNEWYANLIWIQGRKCLLASHAGTMFSVFAPDIRLSDIRPIGKFLVPLIEAQLDSENLDRQTFGQLDPSCVVVTSTADRSVLGRMTDLALSCEYIVERDGGLKNIDLKDLHYFIQRNITNLADYQQPVKLAAEWGKED